jgi:hypothetical protein
VLTRRIDLALEALILCRERLPFLRDLYRPGSPERAALEIVLEGLREADHALTHRRCEQPSAAARPGGAGGGR